uniref:Retrovirus-related Pol polyprotein from transposon TNT 1-94 n=1 Tax=Tanacetum cinerariifolium TaxID=118510 RepID=A0A699IGU0_TANCI|nr:retrovirus-related Pol polyprotein from transposon TNT 1-94 [Tanacetum cinerariifolium]
MQEELLQFKLQEVWTLVDLPNRKRAIGTKWVLRNKKDERGMVIRNKARLVAQAHTQEKGIDYDKVFAPIARIEAIMLFLAYASFKDFVVYQMDVKSAFLYEKIKEEVYVCQPPGFKYSYFLDKVYKVEKALYGLHQASRAWFTEVKNASTPIETKKPMLKDEDGEEIDVHMYRSMIGLLMYLTSSRPDIMFAVCACARYQVNPKVSHLHAVKMIFSSGLLLRQNPSMEKHIYMPRKAKRKDTQVPQLSGPTESVAYEAVYKELDDSLVRAATIASSLKTEQDSSNINKTQSKATPNESSSQGTDSGGGPRVLDLEKTKTTQALEIDSLKRRVKKPKKKKRSRTHKLKRLYKVGLTARVESSDDEQSLGEDASKQGRISDIDSDEGITLVSTHDDVEMFDADQNLGGEEVFVAKQDENVVEEVDAAQVQVSIAATTPTISIDEDKGKAIMIEEPMKLKKKEQIMLDEEVALNVQTELQAKFDKEQRLASEKAQQEEEPNIALIETWDDWCSVFTR